MTRKKAMVILAAALLLIVALPHRFVIQTLVGVYDAKITDTSEANPNEVFDEEADDILDKELDDILDEELDEARDEELDEAFENGLDVGQSEAWEDILPDGINTDMDIGNVAGKEIGETPPALEAPLGYEDNRQELPDILAPDNAEEPIAGEAIFGFSAISSYEAVVYNYSEFQSALENNNGITTVYFGDNITMQLGGIDINSQKTDVVISGLNPLNPGQTVPYTLTDHSSASFYDTVYIDTVGTKSLHIRDLNIIGKNFYGPFSVLDSGSLAGVAVTYERVDYNGPQIGYHRSGTIRFKDCKVRIHGGNGGSTNQEFAEVKHIIFEGVNTVDTVTSLYSVFYIPLGGSFKLADDASLTLKSPNTSAAFGVFYADSYLYRVNISIGKSAVFNAEIFDTFAPELYVTLNSFTVQEGGTFNLKITGSTTGVAFRMGGALTVEKDAKFIISGYGTDYYALLRQASGDITVGEDAVFQLISERPYTALINLIGSAFICDNPASVLLYNANRNIQATTSAGQIYIDAGQVNYWNALSAGGLDDPPLYKWEKADKTNFLIDGTLAIGASGNFSAITSNYTTGEPPGTAPTATTFSMVNARVLAFGHLDLVVFDPTTQSTSISGVTAPGATVRVSFTQAGKDYTFPDVTADSSGVFHVPVGVSLQEFTVIKVWSNWQYLTTSAQAVVGREGFLEFFVPNVLEFFDSEIALTTKTVRRLNPDWKIVVSGSGAASGGWSIYARLNREMTPDDEHRPVLTGSLVFVDDYSNPIVMSTDADTLILKHIPESGDEVFPVVWDKDKGVLLVVQPGTAFADTSYTASISWTLVNGV